MGKRRKYEEAGGVVPLRWKVGPASPEDLKWRSGRILCEVWATDINTDWRDIPQAQVTVRARLCVATQAEDGSLLLNGKPYRADCEIVRRHALFAYPVTARIGLTLNDWPEAP